MNKKLILCVDDEKIVLNSLKEQLIAQLPDEYFIAIAQSGSEALEIIDEYEADGYEILLVISDYVMPGMQGDELLEKVHEYHPESVKILLTGQATLEGISHIINRTGLFRYIQKPWQKEDLVLATVEAIKSFEKDRMIERQHIELVSKNLTLEKWANAIVETLSKTLDSRDTTTAGHSQRMAEYAVKMAIAISESQDPYFKDVHFDEHELETLRFAALLHDVGKIGIRENILLKDMRISSDRMKLIQLRYQFICYQLVGKAKISVLTTDEIDFIKNQNLYLHRLDEINEKNSLEEADLLLLEKLKNLQFENVQNHNGPEVSVLTEEEYHDLNVQYGNLTTEEREVIKSHAEITYDILNSIPWPEHLKRIPEIAASHHERIDGSGYYKHLNGKEIVIQTRILAILDVFEALTSPNRPYRSAESVENAFNILKSEAEAGRMDDKIIDLLATIIKDSTD